jgi:hypothetical protein
MVSKKTFFEIGKPVHVTSRAVVDAFKDDKDCYRFIFQFYTANIGRRSTYISAKDAAKAGQALLYGEKPPEKFIIKEHPPLTDLLDFSLIINHDHLYLIPRRENAIPILMGRLNNGFAKYFNLAHNNRKGAVFGSRYRGVLVTTDFQSYAVTRYVSIINPLDVFQPGWRENGLRNWQKALEFAENFEFSSLPDRLGKRQSLILASREVSERYSFKVNLDEFREFLKEFLKERSSYSNFE